MPRPVMSGATYGWAGRADEPSLGGWGVRRPDNDIRKVLGGKSTNCGSGGSNSE